MKGEDLGAVSAARALLQGGMTDDEVMTELRTQYVLDETVARIVLRHARSFTPIKRAQLRINSRAS